LAQLAADALGLGVDDVRVVLGDTASAPFSSAATIASRSMAVGGGAVVRASARLREKILRIAGHRLATDPHDLELRDGAVRVRDEASRALGLADMAERAWPGWDLPPVEEPGLAERVVAD